MSEPIIIGEPSRTVRTLATLAVSELGFTAVEADNPGALAALLDAHPGAVLVVDEDLLAEGQGPGNRNLVVLAGDAADPAAWARRYGLETGQVRVVQRPVSRGVLKKALEPLLGALTAAPANVDELVAREVERLAGEEIRKVVWRVVPELAERLIREELNRLLKDEDEGDDS